MKAAFAAVQKVKQAVNDVVKDLTNDHSTHYTDTDDTITTYQQRLSTLTDTLNILKDELIKQVKYYQLCSQSNTVLNQQYTQFYVSSSIRSTLLASYNTLQYTVIEQYKHYTEQLYALCIRPLDEWQNDNIEIVDQLTQLITAKQHCLSLYDKLMKAKRNNIDMSDKQQNTITALEQQYTKYNNALTKMRESVINKIHDYLNSRFTRSDEIFLEYLQLQHTLYTTLAKSVDSVPSTIEQYKKQIAAEKQQRTTTASTTQRQTSDSINKSTLHDSNNGYSTTQSNKPGSVPSKQRPIVQHSESEDTDASDSDPYETATDSDTDTIPVVNRKQRATSDVADILNFSGTASNTRTSPSHSNSNNNLNKATQQPQPPKPAAKPTVKPNSTSNTDPLLDFFSPTSAQSTATPTHNNRTNTQAPDFFSANDSGNNTSHAQPTFDFTQPQRTQSNGIHTSKSFNEPPYKPQSTNKQVPKKGFDSFDPFETFTQKQHATHNDIDDTDNNTRRPVSSFSDSNINAHNNSTANNSTTSSIPVNSLSDTSPYSLPYHNFQAADKLEQWEKQPNNQTKHIRILLSTLQTVIWNNSNWRVLQLSDLSDYNSIKKAHRKAILTVHPDKLVNAPEDTKQVAQHIFATLNNAFQMFEKSAKTGQLGF